MKILWQTEHYPDTRKGGGSVTNTFYISRGLRELGEDVTILARGDGSSPALSASIENEPLISFSPPHVPDRLWPLWPYLESKYLAKSLGSIADCFDAFVCHDPGYTLALKHLYPKRPLVSRVGGAERIHSQYVPHKARAPGNSIASLKRDVWRKIVAWENDWVDGRAWSVADALIVQSHFMKTDIEKLYRIPSCKIKVVPSGVDYERFAGACPSKEITSRLGQQLEGKLVVGFCGRLVPMKNVAYLLHGIAKMCQRARVLVLIIGDGDERLNLESLAAALGIRNNVVFVGHTDRVENFLKLSHVFVLPSLYEPFSNALLEATASGLPCIALTPSIGRARTSCSEVILDGETGFVVNGDDPQDLASRLDYLVENQGRCGEMGVNAQRRCRQEYSWKACAERYLETLQELSEKFSTPDHASRN